MGEEIKVDKEYLKAFNLGYELAKELGLKTPIFQDSNLGNSRLSAMQSGMVQYRDEINQEKGKEVDRSLELDGNKRTKKEINSDKNKGNGFDLSI